jgi:hypothetical protein
MANRQASAKAGKDFAAIGALADGAAVHEGRAGTPVRAGQDRTARRES